MANEPMLEFVEDEVSTDAPRPEAVPDDPATASPIAARRARRFAGYRLGTIAAAVVIAALLIWNAWLTREVVTLNRQKIVSVSLASIITDFVRDQSHAQNSPDEAAARAKLYLAATRKALVDLARHGTPVIASEAVLGDSVPDDTARIKATVASALADRQGQH